MTVLKQIISKRLSESNNVNKMIYMAFIGDLEVMVEKEMQQIAHAYEMGVAQQKAGIALKEGNEFYKMNYE